MKGPARLAEHTGTGVLSPASKDTGEDVLVGLWQPDEPERAYDQLHRFYMGRERIRYHGPVAISDDGKPREATVDVIILEWSNEKHPSALKLQQVEDRK